MPQDPHDRIAELEDELKQRDRRIKGLKAELDEARDLVQLVLCTVRRRA